MIESMIIILLGFLFSFLFSGIETGSYMVNRIQLRHQVREHHRSAIALSRLLRRPYIFIYTVLIGNNIAVFVVSREVTDLYLNGGMEAGRLLLGFIPWNAETAATLTLMFPLFLLAELAPKNLFRRKANVLMYRLAGLLQLLVWFFLPLTWPLKQLFRVLTHGSDSAALRDLHRLSPAALREYFMAGEQEGIISSDQNRMVEMATSMHRVPIRSLMTPFSKVPSLPAHATVADFKRLVARRKSTYAVLVHRHRAVGMVALYDVVNRRLHDGDALESCTGEVLELQDNRNLKSAFYRLRRNPRHCAVVVDGRSHPVGLVRLEDIARYIAGQ
jgi:CBS domain containing-hemolysin-like protein